MKKKFMGIALVLASALFVGNVYAETDTSSVCTTNDKTVTCNLQHNDNIADASLADNKITKDIIINANGHTITIDQATTIEKGGSLTITNGTLNVNENLTVNGSLTVKDAANTLTDGTLLTGINIAESKTLTVDGGNLTVTNVGRAFLNKGTIDLKNNAQFTASDNKENVLNGGTFTANNSTITVTNNQKGGLNGTITLTNSKVTATGNGLSGITFNSGSSIDEKSTITATGNNWNSKAYNPDRTPSKADVLFNGDVTIKGNLTADSIAPFKITYATDATNNKVQTTNVTVDGTIAVKEIKKVCDGTGLTCQDAKTVEFKSESKGLVVENDVATVYGNQVVKEGYKFASNISKVVIAKSNSSALKFEVEGGSTVVNNSQSEITVVGNGTTVKIPAAKEGEEVKPVVVGTAPQVSTETEKTAESTEKDDEPGTNDTFPMALVGMITLGLAGTYTYKKLHA